MRNGSGDPRTVLEALNDAAEAFGHIGPTDFETGIDRGEAEWKTQLQKACRLLEAARLLREHDGYHTSVVETSFAVIERTLQFYVQAQGDDPSHEFHDHTDAYERAAQLGLYSEETIEELIALYDANRTEHYYGENVATRQQADAMFDLAEAIHQHAPEAAGRDHEHGC